MAAAKQTAAIELLPLNKTIVEIPIIGDSPLICHAWSEKARKILADAHQQKAKKGREAKVPFNDFADALYWLTPRSAVATEEEFQTGRFGFPAIGFKAAAVDACTSVAALSKVGARQAFHVIGEHVEILGPLPDMREDITRLNGTKPDVRYPPEFSPWGAIIKIMLNTSVMSVEQVFALFDLAGFAVGVGEWRPARNGPYGRFHVAQAGEALPCR